MPSSLIQKCHEIRYQKLIHSNSSQGIFQPFIQKSLAMFDETERRRAFRDQFSPSNFWNLNCFQAIVFEKHFHFLVNFAVFRKTVRNRPRYKILSIDTSLALPTAIHFNCAMHTAFVHKKVHQKSSKGVQISRKNSRPQERPR